MDELIAANPLLFTSATEFKLFLNHFGPFAGRYLAKYPNHWSSIIEQAYENKGDIERQSINRLLAIAQTEYAILEQPELAWDQKQSWVNNAGPFLTVKPPIFKSIINEISDFDLTPASEERVFGTLDEYLRVCRTLLLISPELHIIDPYLNPTKKDIAVVLSSFFKIIPLGKCKTLTIWARNSLVIGDKKPESILKDIEISLKNVTNKANFKNNFKITYNLIRDDDRASKMHARYLLSIKGGIKLDQGFQVLPRGRKVDVNPVGRVLHNEIYKTYAENDNDFTIENTVSLLF